MSEWQPIETAPKDGTIIDLWHKSGGRIVDMWWCDDDTFAGISPDEFSHWMFVPTPPSA